MGRGGRARTQRRHFRQSRENVWKRSKSDETPPSNDGSPQSNNVPHSSWEPFSTQNPSFDEYYKAQQIVSSEEWDSFTATLRTPLPAAFRINSSSQFYKDIRSQLESEFMTCLSEIDDSSEAPLRPLPWYPQNLGWHSNFSRMQLRKKQSLERFHDFLKLENEIGNITRQEAVSMIPPLFLDVSPDHFVLDMCAAPGSKTFQLLETVYHSTKPGTLPNGLVVANDLDVQRCNLLIHQTKRMCTANLVVTNHEAQQFPACRRKNPASQLHFDRVLCDVPCSGDGTLRKAPDIWRKWNAGMGNGVHSLQVQIAMRGLNLLKVGGKMVYSTCSMNPVENEAVVAELLRKCGGSVELVDVSNELPQLVRRPGLKQWKVRDKGVWLASYKSALKYRRNLIVPSMFPSGRADLDATDNENHSTESEENHKNEKCEDDVVSSTTPADELVVEVSDLPLERCMRIVPHDQNSGAFFIAVLHKHSPLPACNSQKEQGVVESSPEQVVESSPADLVVESSPEQVVESSPADLVVENSNDGRDEKASETGSEAELKEKKKGKRKLQIQGKWKGVDPVLFFKDEATIESIKAFYGIDESFPLSGHLVARNPDNNHVKRIYYVSKSVRDVLELNFCVGHPLKIASVGMKMFERQTSRTDGSSAPCAFRISSEGLPVILPHVTKQIVYASLVDFKHLLEYKSVKYADFVDAEFGNNASELLPGCCVVVLKNADELRIAIGCWKGRASLTVMVTALDCRELIERLAVNKQTMETH